VGGITAVTAGAIYEHFGRAAAYSACAAGMLALVGGSVVLAGPAWGRRPEPSVPDPIPVG
jgi:hypothetical protein